MDEVDVTLERQFTDFSRYLDDKRSGKTITLWRSDFWMRQAKIIEDRYLTMTDTGLIWFKLCKTELTFDEWRKFLTELCESKNMDLKDVDDALTECGAPGSTSVTVPEYKRFFDDYEPKLKLIY